MVHKAYIFVLFSMPCVPRFIEGAYSGAELSSVCYLKSPDEEAPAFMGALIGSKGISNEIWWLMDLFVCGNHRVENNCLAT